MSRRLRFMARRTKQQPITDRHVIAFGVRVGYWPCLRAPFISLSVGTWQFDLWHGLRSRRFK